MTASNSPAARPDSKITFKRNEDSSIRMVREDAGMGRLTIDLSMEFAGHATSFAYEGLSKRARSEFSTYRWQKRKNGIVVLDGYKTKTSAPGSPDTSVKKFELHLSDVEVKKISDRRFRRDQFLSVLPRNMLVVDSIANKTYTLGGDQSLTSEGLKSLSEELRSRGFAKDRP